MISVRWITLIRKKESDGNDNGNGNLRSSNNTLLTVNEKSKIDEASDIETSESETEDRRGNILVE